MSAGRRVIFGAVPTDPPWSDRPAFIVAGGPSLRGRDLSRLRERGWVVGVNRAADEVACDATFSVDMVFASRRRAALQRWADQGQEVYLAVPTDYPRPAIPRVTYLKRMPGRGMAGDRGSITNGLNSGYGAIQLAVHRGARRIYLLGYDMVDPGLGPVHWHSGYGSAASRNAVRCWPDWVRRFDQLAAEIRTDIEIINANPGSAIRCFSFTTYEEVGL